MTPRRSEVGPTPSAGPALRDPDVRARKSITSPPTVAATYQPSRAENVSARYKAVDSRKGTFPHGPCIHRPARSARCARQEDVSAITVPMVANWPHRDKTSAVGTPARVEQHQYASPHASADGPTSADRS